MSSYGYNNNTNTDLNNKRPIGIVIAHAPTKTNYKSGDRFQTQGLKINLIYPDGTQSVTTTFSVYPDGALTSDNTFVEIRSMGFVVRQRITVDAKADCNCLGSGHCTSGFVHNHVYECNHPENAKDIKSIRISKDPNKTVYAEGEIFDPTGMEITGRTAGGEDIKVTSYNIETRGPLSSGNNRIEIRYKNLTTTYYASVFSKICTKVAPSTESVKLTRGTDGQICLGTGDFSAEFTDVQVSNGSLYAGISHIYKNNGSESCCGNDWRLNLHCSVKRVNGYSDRTTYVQHLNRERISSSSDDIDYIYTDGAGNRYAFDEVFYYTDENERKQAVRYYDVQVDLDGQLFCVKNEKRYTVTRELKTASGMRLSVKLDNVNGVEKIEQRHEEIAKLESEIQQYKDAIEELEFNIEQNEFYCETYPVPHAELYNRTPSDVQGLLISFGHRPQEFDVQLNRIQSLLSQYNVSEKAPESNDNNAQYIWALQQYNLQLDDESSYIRSKQHERKKALTLQYERQLSEYRKTLEQKERQLIKYKLQVPVAYLINDEGTAMCFNEYGDLCGIVDGYDNTIAVIWDEIYIDGNKKPVTEITSVCYGEHKTTLEYNRNGRLISITDHNGKRIEYAYSRDGQLSAVNYSDGHALEFEYNCNRLLSSVTSPSTAEKAELKYSDGKIIGITQKTSFAVLTDKTASSGSYGYTVSETNIKYIDGKTEVESDGVTKTYYLDYYGNIAASYVKRGQEFTERPTYEYKTEDNDSGYTVTETADAIWTLNELKTSSPSRIAVISSNKLPQGISEFVFSAEANITNETELKNYEMPFKLNSDVLNADTGKNKFCLTAKVTGGKTAGMYKASFDYRNHRAQYVSLPITIDRTAANVSIELFAECSDTQNVVFDNFRLAPAEWESRSSNDFGNITRRKTSKKLIAPEVYRSTQTDYEYDENNRCIKERTAIMTSGKVNETKYAVKKYSYCEHGNLVKTESYIENEVNEKGITITERVCDEKGNVIKEFSYNSLDSSTKFYTESEVAENGITTAEIDETGENKTEFEYIDGTMTVKARKLPNGSKFAYGYDSDGNVTSITQSTADGESNGTEIKYTLGSPTKLTSGNNTVFYEYDKKRRKTKVTVNGNDTTYSYGENELTDEITISDITFLAVKADKVAATFENVTSETYTDKNGNTVMTNINGSVTSACNYNADGQITVSGDGITGSVKKYTYSADALKTLNRVDITAGENVESLTESYFRNDCGQTSGRVIGGAVDQSYAYFYKDNAERELEHISLPNNLNYYPQTDVNGRNTGKELKDGDNNTVYAEYIYYRKVGDHGTNMPSSVYFGKTQNNRFSISDNVKYKYDEMGNISEVRENGVLTVSYAYDKIGRLVRENNRKFGKTWLWSYDNCGNILSKREAQFTLKPADEIEAFTDEKMYAYNGDKLLSFGDEILFYTDTEGKEHDNPLIYRGHQLSWSFERRLASFGDNVFAYDGYGRRIRKNNTVFTYDANNKLIKQSDGTNTLGFIYDNSGLSGVKHNDKEYIYSKDIQGNIISILDKSGREVVQYKYDAWGNVITEVIDEAHAAIAELNPFRYRSYYYDPETNLYYLNTRYYDPETGRFISQDDVSYLDPESVNGLNLYAYCGNNPVMNVDPNGTFAITALLIGLIVGAIIGAAVGGTVAGCVASGNGATGWELAGWIMLGVFGGAVIGGAIGAGLGAAAGAIFPGLNAALAGSLSFAIPTLTNIGGALAIGSATVAVPVGALVAAGAAAVSAAAGVGLSVLFAKRSGKEGATDKPSWVNRGMVDPEKTAQENATDMLNDKYGIGNWKRGAGSEYSKIVKWIIRTVFYGG